MEEIVGCVSLYQHTNSVISLGIEVFPPYRQRGYAFYGVSLALDYAKEKGFRIAVAQVRNNNHASIALHKKLGGTVKNLV